MRVQKCERVNAAGHELARRDLHSRLICSYGCLPQDAGFLSPLFSLTAFMIHWFLQSPRRQNSLYPRAIPRYPNHHPNAKIPKYKLLSNLPCLTTRKKKLFVSSTVALSPRKANCARKQSKRKSGKPSAKPRSTLRD